MIYIESGVKRKSLPTAPPNTPLKGQLIHCSTDKPSTHPSADQSVPNSPGGTGNFAIVFSEGEEEREEEGKGRDELLSSQMTRQIRKVTTFLKMDRLRRTKVPKV